MVGGDLIIDIYFLVRKFQILASKRVYLFAWRTHLDKNVELFDPYSKWQVRSSRDIIYVDGVLVYPEFRVNIQYSRIDSLSCY